MRTGDDPPTEPRRPLSERTEGIKKLILIRVDFSDLAGAPLSDAKATNLVNGLHDFYFENSYGKTGFRKLGEGSVVTPTFRLAKTAAEYGAGDAGVLRTDARAAARAAGIEPRNFDYDVICLGAVPGFGWAGLGAVGAYRSLARHTQLGGVLTVFALP